jgi:hypothetical protein
MGYTLIATTVSVALAVTFLFVADASNWVKVVVALLLVVSFGWRYGFFLRLVLGIGLAIYFAYVKAITERD